MPFYVYKTAVMVPFLFPVLAVFVFSLFSFVPKTNLFNFGPENDTYMQEVLLKDCLGRLNEILHVYLNRMLYF